MNKTVFYSVLLYLLHTLYGFVLLIRDFCIYFTKIWFKDDDINSLKCKLAKIKQKPNHMVVILGNEYPSYKDLANIVFWSVLAGIPIISFYDHNGILKKTKQKLYNILDENNIKYENDAIPKIQNGHKNGTSHLTIRINILSMTDGQNSVAEVTKSWALNNIKNFEIGVQYVDQELRKRLEFPDPELALYCGPICSTYGMLPWQIRVTEFIDIITHHGILFNKYILALQKFENSEQRYGK